MFLAYCLSYKPKRPEAGAHISAPLPPSLWISRWALPLPFDAYLYSKGHSGHVAPTGILTEALPGKMSLWMQNSAPIR